MSTCPLFFARALSFFILFAYRTVQKVIYSICTWVKLFKHTVRSWNMNDCTWTNLYKWNMGYLVSTALSQGDGNQQYLSFQNLWPDQRHAFLFSSIQTKCVLFGNIHTFWHNDKKFLNMLLHYPVSSLKPQK